MVLALATRGRILKWSCESECMSRSPKNPSETPTRPSVPRVAVVPRRALPSSMQDDSACDAHTAATVPPPPGSERDLELERRASVSVERDTLPHVVPSEASREAREARAARATDGIDSHSFGELDIRFPRSTPSGDSSSPSRPTSRERAFEDEAGSASFAALLSDDADNAPPQTHEGARAPRMQALTLRDGQIRAVAGSAESARKAATRDPADAKFRERAPRMRRTDPPDAAAPGGITAAPSAAFSASKRRSPITPTSPSSSAIEPSPPTVRDRRKVPPSSPPPAPREPARRESGREGRSAFAAVDEVVANLKKDPRSE
jgi:hypothetical protein